MNNNEIVPGFDDETNKNLKIRLQTIGDIPGGLILYLSGYIDTYNFKWFQRQGEKVISKGYIRLIIDLSGLGDTDLSGLGAFTYFLKEVKIRGGNIVILNPQDKVREVMELVGFGCSWFYNIQKNLEEAVAFFTQDEG